LGIYDRYASIYDASGQISFSLQMLPYLDGLLTRHPVTKGALLELACGTGTVALAMARKGWRVYGVDGSAQMLAEARRKEAKARSESSEPLDIQWAQQDMRHLCLSEPVQLATCLYDSLNYMLVSDDLQAVFRGVYHALEPGGLFIFDMNTPWALATFWDDSTYVTDTPDLTVILESRFDSYRQRTTVKVIGFAREGELYRKAIEEHTEQGYPREHIATLLTDVGFQIEGMYHCFTFEPPTASCPRILWAARKPGPLRQPTAHGDISAG
jgi:SAM-dependent methyltransferase